MDAFSIVLSEVNAVFSGESSPMVDGGFYVHTNGVFFPSLSWTDYVDSVLCMWTENILRNQGKGSSKYVLYFMDGPFQIKVAQQHDDLLLKGIDGHSGGVAFTAQTTVNALLEELFRAFETLERIVVEKSKNMEQSVIQPILNTTHYYKNLINRVIG